MWLRVFCLLAITSLVTSDSSEFFGQIIEPAPQGGSFSAPYNGDSVPHVLSYLVSVTHSEQSAGELEEPPSVRARVFLGNSEFAGHPTVWTNQSMNGDWVNLKKYVAIDPCVGTQAPNTFAWLLVDPSNLTLVADVAVGSYPLRTLTPEATMNADASMCLHLSKPMAGEPQQCDQYFLFDFLTNVPESMGGFRWGFTLTSTNGNPLPFSSAIVAGGPSCPSNINAGLDTWFTVPLDPAAPGNSPTKITVSSLAIGTHHQKWWIKLQTPQVGETSTPFSIVGHYEAVHIEPPTDPIIPSSPTSSTPPTTDTPPTGETPTNTPRAKKPLPLWAIILISASCILLAAGALFWAWRLTRQPNTSNSYEIY